MRTAHSSVGRAAIQESSVAAFPAELSPVIVAASAGVETELQTRLLDSHPAIHARGESLPGGECAPDELRKTMLALAENAVSEASMSLRRGAASPLRVVCAGIDSSSATAVDRVLAALGEVRVLGLIRDGRDVVVAERMAALRSGTFEGLSPAACSRAAAAAAFLCGRGTEPARLFCPESLRVHTMRWIGSLRAAFRAVERVGERARIVRFEDLVQETVRTHAATCRWLGVAADAAHVHSAIEASRSQFARAERPGMWRNAMSEADKTGFKRMAGELLVELGYEQGTRW